MKDTAVDRILEVMDEYQVKISDLEHDLLIDPNMEVVRSRAWLHTFLSHSQR